MSVLADHYILPHHDGSANSCSGRAMQGESSSLFAQGRWAYLGMVAPQTCSIFYNDAPFQFVGPLYPYVFLAAEGLGALVCCLLYFGRREGLRSAPRRGVAELLCCVSLPLLLVGLGGVEWLVFLAAMVAGVGVTLGYVRWIGHLARLDVRRAIGLVLVVFVLTGLIKLMALGLPYGVYGLIVVLMLGFSLCCERTLAKGASAQSFCEPAAILKPYLPIAVEFVVLSLTLGCLNGLAQVESTALVHILLRLAGALVLFAVLYLNRHPIDLVPLVQICLLVAIAGPLLSALFPIQEKALLAAGWCLMQMLVFVVVLVVQKRTGCSPWGLFGLGWSIFCLGITAGYFLALVLPGASSAQRIVLVIVSVVSVVTVYLLMRYQKGGASLNVASAMEAQTPEKESASRRETLERLGKQYRLTDREMDVVLLLDRGLSKRRIAEELIVSENTVRMHVKNIYAKLGIHSKQELMAIADGRALPPLPPTSLLR